MSIELDNENMREMTEKIVSNMKNDEIRKEVIDNISVMSISMDSKDIKKIIEELIKFEDGKKALKLLWKIIINNSNNPENLITTLGSDNSVKEDMLKNIEYFFKFSSIRDSSILAREIAKLESGNETIAENFDKFINNSIINLDDIIIPTIQTETGREIVKRQFESLKDRILKNHYVSGVQSFFRVIKALENVKGFEEIYEDYGYWAKLYDDIDILGKNKSSSKIVVGNVISYDTEDMEELFGEKIKPGTILTMEDIIGMDAKNQEFTNILYSKDRAEKRAVLETVANGNRYSFKSAGTSSLTIVAGDQVAKIGSKKRKFEIPYHPRLMMPYFRKRYEDDSTLEIYNLGNTESVKITDESLLEIYKELEKAGIIWTDAHKENIVELLSDNILPDFIKSEDFNLFGFLEDERFPTIKHRPLKKGDLVVCDLDMLYLKDDPDIQIGLQDDVILQYQKSKTKEAEAKEV